jgi:hypothetical protein
VKVEKRNLRSLHFITVVVLAQYGAFTCSCGIGYFCIGFHLVGQSGEGNDYDCNFDCGFGFSTTTDFRHRSGRGLESGDPGASVALGDGDGQ